MVHYHQMINWMGRMARNFFYQIFTLPPQVAGWGAWLDHENAHQFKISPSGMQGNHSTLIKQTIYEKPLLMAILSWQQFPSFQGRWVAFRLGFDATELTVNCRPKRSESWILQSTFHETRTSLKEGIWRNTILLVIESFFTDLLNTLSLQNTEKKFHKLALQEKT